MIPENLTFDTAFTVLPKHCNYMMPMIFGGALFSEMDLGAACCAARALRNSECDSAVTYKCDLTFHDAAEMGDIVFLKASIVELRRKAIVMVVRAMRERRNEKDAKLIAEGRFVFVSKKGSSFMPHGLEMPKGEANEGKS